MRNLTNKLINALNEMILQSQISKFNFDMMDARVRIHSNKCDETTLFGSCFIKYKLQIYKYRSTTSFMLTISPEASLNPTDNTDI